MPNFRQLQCLVAISKHLHFGRAAGALNLSQPALSAQLSQLEEELGVLLVERTKRRVLMTSIGQETADRAEAILRDVTALEEAAKRSQKPLSGTLKVGVLRTLGPYLLPHILRQMRQQYPDLKLYLREEPRSQLLAELVQGDLDMVILCHAPEDDEFLTITPLFHEPLWAVLPLGHRLSERMVLKASDFDGEQIIMLEVGDGLREPALELCRQGHATEHPDFKATSLDTLRQMVGTGLGITLLPALYVHAEALNDDQVVVLSIDPAPTRSIDLIWRRTTSRSEEFRLLAALVLKRLPSVVQKRSV